MVEITYQMVLSTLQTVGLLVGIAYYLIIMRNSQRTRELTLQSQELTRKAQEQALETRQVQLFMNAYNKFDEDVVNALLEVMSWEWEDFDDFWEKYGWIKNRDKFTATVSKVAMFYEGIGVLVKEGYLNIRLIALMIGGVTMLFWEKMESVVLEGRVKTNEPRWMSETEYLYKALKKYMDEHPELIP
jgi:hypothetical protein